MDFLEFVLGMSLILAASGLIFTWIRSRNALILQDLAEKRRISTERSKAAKLRYEQSSGSGPDDLGAWVPELLEGLGLDPALLFADEIPPELAKLIPLAKGFLGGGGLQKLLGGSQQQEDEQRKAI